MIKEINIENFRSIKSSKIKFTPFSVIVGANASGKSNLIKAIEFLANSTYYDIKETIEESGGFEEMLPKQIKRINKEKVKFSIEYSVNPPKEWKTYELPDLNTKYEFEIQVKNNIEFKITKEELTIENPLLYSHFQYRFQRSKKTEIDINNLKQFVNSQIVFKRNRNNDIKVETNFELDENTLIDYANWIDLSNMFSKVSKNGLNKKELDSSLEFLINGMPPKVNKKTTLILSRRRFIHNFSRHFALINFGLGSCGKYDLLLSELRKEQSIMRGRTVTSSGDNLPSILQSLQSKENEASLFRIEETMSYISPYFVSAKSKELRAGKEYLAFQEIFEGKEVPSWDASDGTLRALAILISLETHGDHSTIMIEEPEHGLHPWAIKHIVNHIRDVVKRKNLQVIITTHSRQILDNIAEDELIISNRNIEGTRFSSISEVIPNKEVKMTDIGDLWVSGLLSGVPKSE